MKKFKKTFNPNRIKINYSYSVNEIVKLLGVNKFTVLNWHKKEGLMAIDDRIPYIFQGKELRRFIRERQEKRKQKCAPNEIFCLRCRKPRSSAGNRVIIIINNRKKMNIQGICPFCGSRMNRRGTTENLSYLSTFYCIEEIRNKHLLDYLSPTVIINTEGETKNERIHERSNTV